MPSARLVGSNTSWRSSAAPVGEMPAISRRPSSTSGRSAGHKAVTSSVGSFAAATGAGLDDLVAAFAVARGVTIAHLDSLDEARLKGVIRYRRVSTPDEFVQPLMPALDHWFNHQTHHRGQAHVILTSLGKKAPELDLLYYQREVEAGRA